MDSCQLPLNQFLVTNSLSGWILNHKFDLKIIALFVNNFTIYAFILINLINLINNNISLILELELIGKILFF